MKINIPKLLNNEWYCLSYIKIGGKTYQHGIRFMYDESVRSPKLLRQELSVRCTTLANVLFCTIQKALRSNKT